MENAKHTLHFVQHFISGASNGDDSGNGEAEMFEQKLNEIADQMSNTGLTQPPLLANLCVEQVVISTTHMAFLLDNGRICRISYQFNSATQSQNNETINIPVINSNSTRASKHSKTMTSSSSINSSSQNSVINTSSATFRPQSSSRSLSSSSIVAAAAAAAVAAAAASNTLAATATTNNTTTNNPSNPPSNQNPAPVNPPTTATASGSMLRANEAFIIPTPHDILSGSSLSHTFTRGFFLTNNQLFLGIFNLSFYLKSRRQLLRGRNLIVGSSRQTTFVPASAVPESLIESVQTVLQSKSRNVIIRELQRTVRFHIFN